MRTNKAFDAPASKKDVVMGVAAEVAKQVRAGLRNTEDADDASELGGRGFRIWLEELIYDSSFVREVNMQLGSNEFNSEFFIDGLFGGNNG